MATDTVVYSEHDIKRLKKRKIEDIIALIGMANLPLIIGILHQKFHGRVRFLDVNGDCVIRYGRRNVANMSYLATHLHFLEIRNEQLIITGNTSIPAVYQNHCRFFALANGREMTCHFFDAGMDQKIGDWTYEIRTAFHLTIDLHDIQKTNLDTISISFGIETDGIKSISGKINSLRFMPVADVLPNQFAFIDGWFVQIEGGTLIIRKSSSEQIQQFESMFQNNVLRYDEKNIESGEDQKETVEVITLRKEFFRRKEQKKKPIWLFFDRFDKADDNGEVMFSYMNEHWPDYADYYYVIDKDCVDYQRLSAVGMVIPALSEDHQLLLLLADYILTSQMNGFIENPFGNKEEYFRDLYHRPKVVFLQHGITKDDQTGFLGELNQNLFALAVSSKREKKEFMRKPYGLREEQIWLTGLPRFDRLYHSEKRRILIMPTWRKSLLHIALDPLEMTDKISRWVKNDCLEDSIYIHTFRELLNSTELKILCDKYQYSVAFVPHPLMRPYVNTFAVPDWIHIYPYDAHYRDIFAEGSLLITDYSSVAFDFVYPGKPVIYYQFDEEAFFADHTYEKGYFDYRKDGFGEVVATQNDLLEILRDYLKDDCRMKQQFEMRRREFFSFQDKQNCQRIAEKLLDDTYQSG